MVCLITVAQGTKFAISLGPFGGHQYGPIAFSCTTLCRKASKTARAGGVVHIDYTTCLRASLQPIGHSLKRTVAENTAW